MFTSYGRLNYDPVLGNRFNNWWALLDCNDGLTYYYRKMVTNNRSRFMQSCDWLKMIGLPPSNDSWTVKIPCASVVKPAWGNHISVIRGEQPINQQYWKKYQKMKFNFQYNPEDICTNGRHWWLTIVSKDLEDLRVELGLTPHPTYIDKNTGQIRGSPLHLTFGRNAEVPSSKA